MGFSGQECWSGLPCLPPGDLPDPGIEPASLTSLGLAGGFLPGVPPGKPPLYSQVLNTGLLTLNHKFFFSVAPATTHF